MYPNHIETHRVLVLSGDSNEVRYRFFFVAGGSSDDKKL